MTTRKYPPQDDAGLIAAGQLMQDGLANPAEYSLTAADATRLSDALAAATAAFAANVTAQAQARANRVGKDEAMDALEEILSELNRRVQPLSTITDEQRKAIGLPIYDTTPTEAAAPGEIPVVKIDAAQPLRHEIRFSGEQTRGRPAGVKAIEIYIKIGGTATANVSDYQFLAQDSESPYVKDFAVEDAAKQVHYLFCWVNSNGDRGAWRMASATITSELQTSR